MNKNTSWHKVADWYKKVPKNEYSNHQQLIIPRLKELFKRYLFPEAEVLDLACGEGSVTAALFKEGYKLTGIDLAEGLIEEAKKDYPEISFSVEDTQQLSPGFLKENSGKFDAVLSVLALQNIRNLKATIANSSKLLKPKGLFIFVLNHPSFRIPKHSAWGFKRNEKQYRIIDSYLSEQEIPITAHPGIQDSPLTWSYHRPLEFYVKLLRQYGLSIIDLEEWASQKKSEPGPRAKAEDRARREIPLFMCIIAKK